MIPRTGFVAALLAGVALSAGAVPAAAQSAAAAAQRAPTETQSALAREVERRFDVLPLSNGLALRPRRTIEDVRSIEIRAGAIAVNGTPVTGAELRDRLGADAEVLMQLSYLDDDTRRALFERAALPVPAPPQPPEPAVVPTPPATPQLEPRTPGESRERDRRRRSGDRIRFGGGITVEEGELITGDVVAFGGPVRVRGEVRGEVVAIGGSAELAPTAVVGGDVVAIGGAVRQEPGARVGGEVHEVRVSGVDLRRWNWARGPWDAWWGWTFGAVFALLSTLIRVAILCVLAAIVVLLAREHVERIGTRAAAEPLKAGAVGVLSQLLFLPILIITVVILVLTLIGIPLLVFVPFLILGLLVVALVGFTAVGNYLGHHFGRRMGWADLGPYAATLLGILLIVSPLLLARLVGLGGGMLMPMTVPLRLVAGLVEYAAWTVGFGAVALAWFNRPRTPAVAVP